MKLYFLCGLPGERKVDLDGIVEMAETIAQIGKRSARPADRSDGQRVELRAQAHTPYQWNGMQTREYFHWAHQYLKSQVQVKSVKVKCHPVETSLLEGLLSRGDRRVARSSNWRGGAARLDSWTEQLQPELWWQAAADCGVDVQQVIHTPYELIDRLPWDHLNVKKGRTYLEKEQQRAGAVGRDGRVKKLTLDDGELIINRQNR